MGIYSPSLTLGHIAQVTWAGYGMGLGKSNQGCTGLVEVCQWSSTVLTLGHIAQGNPYTTPGDKSRQQGFTTVRDKSRPSRAVSRPAYLSVFACIRAEIGRQYGSMPVFLKIWTQSVQQVWKSRRERCKFVSSKADRRALMGSYHLLTFAYFKSFQG